MTCDKLRVTTEGGRPLSEDSKCSAFSKLSTSQYFAVLSAFAVAEEAKSRREVMLSDAKLTKVAEDAVDSEGSRLFALGGAWEHSWKGSKK